MKPKSKQEPINPPQSTDRLEQAALFNDVPLASIHHVLAHCEERKLAYGELLLRPDAPNEELYVILIGHVSIHLDHPDSPSLTTLGPGECVGEMSLFDGQPPSAYVKAIEPSVVLAIERQTLWALIDASHGVARNLLRLLSRRIRASNSAISEVQQQKQHYEHDASHDALTGLNNRRWLDAFLSGFQGRDLAPCLPLSVVMLDVDHFKQLNDEYGHPAGDEILRELAGVLRQNVRPPDLLARYGGEEFIIILLNTSQSGARVLAERLLERVAAHRMQFNGRDLPPVTISAGIADSREVQPVEHLIGQADAALYRAKRAGRNRVSD